MKAILFGLLVLFSVETVSAEWESTVALLIIKTQQGTRIAPSR